MPIQTTCGCGAEYLFKDEHAGRSVTCRSCDVVMVVPGESGAAPVLQVPTQEDGKGPFERDLFRMRQRVFSITERYDFVGHGGKSLLYVERPIRWLRSIGSIVAGLAVGYLLYKAGAWAYGDRPLGPGYILVVVGPVLAGLAAIVATHPKRDAFFYADDSKAVPLLRVKQDQVWAPLTLTYTVTAPDGTVIALMRKNHLYDFWRKRWHVLRPDGALWALAQEDSIILSLLRRLLGNMYGLLRINFVIEDAQGNALGTVGRDFNLLDRYTLDLGPDTARVLDRRVGVALAVLLDSGERR